MPPGGRWLDKKGSGLISVDGGSEDVFVHFCAIESNGFRTLDEDQRVEFDIAHRPKGRQVERVRTI